MMFQFERGFDFVYQLEHYDEKDESMTGYQRFEDFIEENEYARFFYGGFSPDGRLIRSECADSIKDLLAILCTEGAVKPSVIEEYGFWSIDDILDVRASSEALLGLITYQTYDYQVVVFDRRFRV